MNVSLQKLFLGLLFLLAVPLVGKAGTIERQTYRGTPLEYVFASHPYNPSFLSGPEHGERELTDMGGDNYKITYTPDPDFVGTDQIRFTVWSGYTWEIRKLIITVLPSKVEAHPDIAYTYEGLPVDIDVVANDVGSAGNLKLKSVLLVNNGSAEIADPNGVISFSPASGFRGIAQLNYVVCDIYGSCDQGSVSINVLGGSALETDTIRIFTKKNQSQDVLIPPTFSLTVPPANGSFNADGMLPSYMPLENFTGEDYLEFSDGNDVIAVEVVVLDIEDNRYAFDDDVATTSYSSVEFNVLENDYYGRSSGCFRVNQPEFGTVKKNGYPRGSLTYSPPEGFQGIDRFTYTIQPPDCNEEPETATVYVYVSNFEPAFSKFSMVTPKRTPLIIGYNVPIRNFEFKVTDQGDLGKARFLSGRVDTTIYGQRIQGYNMIVYIPGDDVDSGLDEFEVEYCVTKNRECRTKKLVKIEIDILDIGDGTQPMCFDDCIWAGDTNFDGIVNMEDLLPLGAFMGQVGVPRNEVNFDLWYGQYGSDWGVTADNTARDLKHVDTNGDSLITALDTLAISRFYGNTHSLAPAPIPNYKDTIELHGNVFLEPGDTVELDMVLGKEGSPAVNMYGFVFPFNYNPDFFVAESAAIEYLPDSWLSYGSPTLSMTKNNGRGFLESGFTRTNGKVATGIGKIGKMRIVVEGDIEGFRPDDEEILVDIGGGVATVLGQNGQRYGVQVGTVTLHINLKGKPKKEEPVTAVQANNLVNVYPNPTRDFLNVDLEGGYEFQRVMVYNLAGQQMFDSGALQAQRKRINVSNLRNGIYFLRVQTEWGMVHKKVEIIR